jgi:hypothetical protein
MFSALCHERLISFWPAEIKDRLYGLNLIRNCFILLLYKSIVLNILPLLCPDFVLVMNLGNVLVLFVLFFQ